MLQIYSIVHNYTLKKLNSQAYITKTYREGKPLPLGTFVLKRNFTHVHFSDKLKPLRIGAYKILDRLSDVTYELLDIHKPIKYANSDSSSYLSDTSSSDENESSNTTHPYIPDTPLNDTSSYNTIIIKLVTLIYLILVFVTLLTARLFLHSMIHLKLDILNLIID